MKKNNFCTFYIVRHGETDWNLQHKVQGTSDIELNATGILQATELANKLKNIHFDRAFSSDLLRAEKTAKIINLERKLALETTKALRERRFGKIEGQHSEVFIKINKFLDALSEQERFTHKFDPEYESDEEILTRVITFFREVAVANPRNNILVVTHGGVLRSLVNKINGTYNPKMRIGNTAYLILESDGVEFNILKTHNMDLD